MKRYDIKKYNEALCRIYRTYFTSVCCQRLHKERNDGGSAFDDITDLRMALVDLQRLLDMHNKPLKLEEIKPDMWVWDRTYKAYVEVEMVDDKMIHLNFGEFDYRKEYKEDRFYRYQPLEEE